MSWPCFQSEMMKSFLKAFCFLFLLIASSVAQADNVKEGNRLYDAGKYREAMVYFMKPDAVKKPLVMNRIGYMYSKGRGVEANPEQACQWYRKAAEAGLAAAQFNLGLMYEKGQGV